VMWCTRWFLILFLLPYPRASPFFLALYLFSLILHSRPCLYCVVLLTALFTSSCYWAPTALPMPSFLTATSLNSSVKIPDQRCWCDINDGHIFDPFPPVVKQSQTAHAQTMDDALANDTSTHGASRSEETTTPNPRASTLYSVLHLLDGSALSWPGWQKRPAEEDDDRTPQPTRSDPLASSDPTQSMQGGLSHSPLSLESWLKRRYDLREHGIGLILDFGWGRSSEAIA